MNEKTIEKPAQAPARRTVIRPVKHVFTMAERDEITIRDLEKEKAE